MRDYITYEIQKTLSSIDELQASEQIEAASRGGEKKEAESVTKQKRLVILKRSHSPSAVYQFLAATKEPKATATAFRTEWQKNNERVSHSRDAVIDYYKKFIETPTIDLIGLPTGSFVMQFTFTLAQPYISHDEQDFYIIDNPIRKDKISGLPYVASTSWKGSLRAALWQLGFSSQDEAIDRLFGNEKGEEKQENLHAGRLYFFPTFFMQKSLEIINPHDRERRIGKNPILFESVPGGATGSFTLLYVPFDSIGKDEKVMHEQIAQELPLIAKGLQAMFRIYGFGAKTSSGFGCAKESVANGLLRLRVKVNEVQKAETASPISQPLPSLARYLEAPDRLKSEYLTSEGAFRERTEAELKNMSKADKQMYDKAKNWWQREGKQPAEVAKQTQPVEQTVQETQTLAKPIAWPEYSFRDFAQLVECANERAEELRNRGGI